jgi:GT2 family glycosyltransferase
VLLLNPDTEVQERALDALVDFMDAHPEAGAAGSMLLNPDGTLQPSCFPLPTLSRELWRMLHLDKIKPYGVYDMRSWSQDEPREVEDVQGASMILRRKALQQVGLLDEDYFMYTEEVDLCYRLRKNNWHIFWVPQSSVMHYGGQSTQQIAEKMFLSLYQTKLLYFRKNRGKAAALTYKAIILIASLIRLAISPFIWLKPAPERARYWLLARYYLHLLKTLPQM